MLGTFVRRELRLRAPRRSSRCDGEGALDRPLLRPGSCPRLLYWRALLGRDGTGRKAAPIVAWRYREMALERGTHPFLIAKTAAARDAIDALLGLFEQAPGGFQPEHLDRLGRCAPRLSLVAPGEISWAHADAFGELIDIQSFVTEILRYPDVKVFEGRRGQGLRLQELAELRLSAWPLQIDHKLAGDLHGNLAATILLNQSQREIDSRGDPRRRPDGTVLNEDRVRLDRQVLVAKMQRVARSPVGHDTTSVEEAGFGQQEGSRTDRGRAPCHRRMGRQPVHQATVGKGGLHFQRTGNHYRVDLDAFE